MYKLIESAAFNKEGEAPVTILNLTRSREIKVETGLTKAAAHEDIEDYVSKLIPKPNHTYLHINAMTAGEYHGPNRNADFFPEENLKKCYKTFETSPAYVYRSHINKDPNRSYGKVIFALYNDRMHRVELIAECPDELIQDVKQRIEAGDFPTTSMATKTPYDTCSICNNKARSRDEYCSHLKYELNKLYPDGRKVFAINDGPLRFFDISFVVRPADVNSSVLNKVAYQGTLGSAELAELEGINDELFLAKKAEMKKWSELTKEINEGFVDGVDKDLSNLLSKVEDLPQNLVNSLSTFELNEVLQALAKLGISPSLRFLAELMARKTLGEGYEGIGRVVEQFASTVEGGSLVPVIQFQDREEINPRLHNLLAPHAPSSSLFPSMVEKRASGVGYAGLGPHLEPTEEEEMKAKNLSMVTPEEVKGFSLSYKQLLLGLLAAAFFGKKFINSQIEKARLQSPENNVKIVIIKKASDYNIATLLSKAAMVKEINGKKADETFSSFENNVIKTVVKNSLKNSGTAVGAKLYKLMKLIGVGQKISENI